jgi:AhpD family alkylhydroperoxidase
MVDEQTEKRKKDLIAEIKRERGYLPAPWVYLAEKDIEFMEAYNRLYSKGLSDGKALPAKTRELIAIALLAYRGLGDAVYEHAKRALKLGATMQELLEAVETSMIPGGTPTLGLGLRALLRIEEEQKKEK